jgi:hypothetical protein
MRRYTTLCMSYGPLQGVDNVAAWLFNPQKLAVGTGVLEDHIVGEGFS